MPRPLVTTPLFYTNSVEHIGHAASSVLADALARWTGADLLTGTDEHGSKIFDAAKARGMAPQPFVDEVSASFETMARRLDIRAAARIRTTAPEHARTVHALWSRLRPHIELQQHQGWYCAAEEAFIPDKDVNVEAQCVRGPLQQRVHFVSEPNYKFLFDPARVRSAVDSMEILPASRRAEVNEWLRSPTAGALSVSRPRERVPWALPVPGDDTQSIYVWVDALAGYLKGAELDPDCARPALVSEAAWPRAATHVVGKDILRFHAVVWPALLLAAGLEPPARVVAHGHWLVDGKKMSKSIGNVVAPLAVLDGPCAGQPDLLRYFLLRYSSLDADADFARDVFRERVNADLANNLGNLLSRATAKALWAGVDDNDVPVVDSSEHASAVALVSECYRAADFAKGLERVMLMLNDENRRIESRAPWKDAKAKNWAGVASTLALALNTLRIASVLLAPATPGLARTMQETLGVQTEHALLEPWRVQRPLVGRPVLVNKIDSICTRT